MPRTLLTNINVTRAGVVDASTAANALGNNFSNDGNVFLKVTNGGASSINVLFSLYVDGIVVSAARTVAVANGATAYIGPFPGFLGYLQPDGTTWVDYSAVTSVTVQAIRFSSSS